MVDDIRILFKKAAEIVFSFPKKTRIRVISHYDADGSSAAGIICQALFREGYDFHVTLMRNPFTKGFDRIKKENNELIIFSDMGSGQIETIEELGVKAIIIDHHQVLKEKTTENILQINSNLCGINGNYEACGASLSYSFAMALNQKNKDLVALALAGITGDKQYIGGIRGYNETILKEAIENGFVKEYTGMKLSGESISDALFYSIEPFFKGVSGNKSGVLDLLKNLNIDDNSNFENITEEQKKRLQSYLMFLLVKNGCEKNILDTVIRKRYWSENLNCEMERFADILDACSKGGNRGLSLQLCLGYKDSFEEAVNLEKGYKKKILDELNRLERENAEEKESFRYFYSDDSSLGGVIGGIATNFIFDKEKPLISLVKKDDEIHISARGNQYLVEKGLDLGLALKNAAQKLNGYGGGHKIAAGATISIDKEDEFLEIVNESILKQIKE